VRCCRRRQEYAPEDIEKDSLAIIDPGNELLKDLVDEFYKNVWVAMPQVRIACFNELQASNIGAIVGEPEMEGKRRSVY
jgi:hypothetical protein